MDPSDVDWGTVLVIVGGIASLFYLVRMLRAQNTQAQLNAKDAVIATQLQSAHANEERIALLEQQVSEALGEIKVLRSQLEAVEKYAAPEAVRRFEKQQGQMIELLKAIHDEVSSREGRTH